MNKSLSYRMTQARNQMMQTANEAGRVFDLPAFIMEEIVADILGELRQVSKVELLRELEMQNDESIQSDNVEE